MSDKLNYSLGDIDNGGSAVLAGNLSSLLRDERPELVNVHGGAELLVPLESELPHAALAEVAGVTALSERESLTICSC